MINTQTDQKSTCQREVENLTEEEASLFLKLVKLCKDPLIAQRLASPEVTGNSFGGEATTTTGSTVTSESETSSQDYGYVTAQEVSNNHSFSYSACEQPLA